MKKLSLIITGILLITGVCHAQTNTAWSTTGNIGIGTTSPSTALTVFGTILSSVTNAAGDNNNVMCTNPSAANTTGDRRGDIWLDNDGRFKFRCTTGYGLAFRNGSNTADVMNITDAGLSIGTQTMPSGYMFAVNGSGVAKAFYVTLNGWSDYVFDAAYKLPTLTEVKTYITQNHHLPDMPSAGEVEKNGLNIGEADKLLTKKVEELTLYLIEKDKQLNDEKGTNNKEQQQIDEQSAELKQNQTKLQDQGEKIKLQEDRITALEIAIKKLTGSK